MLLEWMLVTLIGSQVIESGVTFNAAKLCFEQAVTLQSEAGKAVDKAFAAVIQQNPAVSPARPQFSCIVTVSLRE